ncbi:MAG: hypothetical protein AAFY71_16810 [Bacteroidota bacterium]
MKGLRLHYYFALALVQCILMSCQQQAASAHLDVQMDTKKEFIIFLQEFNENQDFQLSRIKFPLEATVLVDDFTPWDVFLTKEQYHVGSLPIHSSQELTVLLSIDSTYSSVMYKGAENGIMAEYYFEKLEGIWFLVKMNDLST